MRISYIILAYDSPGHLARLVSRLDAPDVRFVIHIDRKSDLGAFRRLLSANARVRFVPDTQRVDCRWGDLSLVEAVLACCRMVVDGGAGGYVALLSGHDYPLRTPAYIDRFLTVNAGHDFMNVYPVPDLKKKSENGGMERFLNYTFDCRNPRDARMKAKIRPLSLNLKTMLGFVRLVRYRRELLPMAAKRWLRPRHYPGCLAMVFNELWFVLRVSTVRYILNFIEAHSEVMEYYKFTHIPDETIFGSIICSDSELKKSLRPMCHLIDWTAGNNGSPRTFTVADFPFINSAVFEDKSKLFARKFKENDSVLDMIDNILLELDAKRVDGKNCF